MYFRKYLEASVKTMVGDILPLDVLYEISLKYISNVLDEDTSWRELFHDTSFFENTLKKVMVNLEEFSSSLDSFVSNSVTSTFITPRVVNIITIYYQALLKVLMDYREPHVWLIILNNMHQLYTIMLNNSKVRNIPNSFKNLYDKTLMDKKRLLTVAINGEWDDAIETMLPEPGFSYGRQQQQALVKKNTDYLEQLIQYRQELISEHDIAAENKSVLEDIFQQAVENEDVLLMLSYEYAAPDILERFLEKLRRYTETVYQFGDPSDIETVKKLKKYVDQPQPLLDFLEDMKKTIDQPQLLLEFLEDSITSSYFEY